MQKIMYAGDEFLTGDEIAEALLAYSRALGDDDRAEIVDIPVQEDDGTVVRAKFLIGPASQLVVKAVPGAGPEVVDVELVERLRQLTRGTEAPTGEQLELPGQVADDLD